MSNTIEITGPETGKLIKTGEMEDELLEKVFDGEISLEEAVDITIQKILNQED